MPALRLENRHTGEILDLWRERRNGETILNLRGSLPAQERGPPAAHPSPRGRGRGGDGRHPVRAGGRQTCHRGNRPACPAPEGHPPPLVERGETSRWRSRGCTRPGVDLDRYLQAVFEIMNAGPPNRPSIIYMAHASLRHRSTQTVLLMPPAIQAVVFRVVVALGTLLGRYRGTDWPGCPVRCTGAPEIAGTVA